MKQYIRIIQTSGFNRGPAKGASVVVRGKGGISPHTMYNHQRWERLVGTSSIALGVLLTTIPPSLPTIGGDLGPPITFLSHSVQPPPSSLYSGAALPGVRRPPPFKVPYTMFPTLSMGIIAISLDWPVMGLIHLRLLASQDLTYYFPPPFALACPGLVTDGTLTLPYADFTPTIPSAMHNSVQTQLAQNTQLDQSDWYTAIFQPHMKQFYKGPLVWGKKYIAAQAADANNPR